MKTMGTTTPTAISSLIVKLDGGFAVPDLAAELEVTLFAAADAAGVEFVDVEDMIGVADSNDESVDDDALNVALITLTSPVSTGRLTIPVAPFPQLEKPRKSMNCDIAVDRKAFGSALAGLVTETIVSNCNGGPEVVMHIAPET